MNPQVKFIISLVTGIIVAALAIKLCLVYFEQGRGESDQNPDWNGQLIEFTSEYNKHCPIMLDSITRLDNMMAVYGDLIAQITLLKFQKAYIDTNKLKQRILARMVNRLKSDPKVKLYEAQQTTIGYDVSDKNGIFIMRILLTPELYANDSTTVKPANPHQRKT